MSDDAQDQAVLRGPRRLVTIVALVSLVDFIFGATYVFQMLAAGVGASMVGVLVAVAGVISMVFEAPSGALGDRLGHRAVMIAGLVTWGVGQAAFGVATGVWAFGLALVLWGVGMSLYSGAPSSLVVNELSRAGRMDLMPRTVRRAQNARWVSSAVGAAAVLLLESVIEPAALISCSGLVLVGAAAWVYSRWPASATERSGEGVAAHLVAGASAAWNRTRGPVAAALAIGLLQAVLLLCWQPLVTEALAWPESVLGGVLLVLTIAAALGSFAADRLGKLPPRTANLLCVSLLGLALVSTLWSAGGVIAGLILAEFALGAAMAVNAVWAHAVFPDHLRNTLSSLSSTVAGLGMAAVQVVFGLAWDRWGIVLSTGFGAALLLLVVLGFWPAMMRASSTRTPETTSEVITP